MAAEGVFVECVVAIEEPRMVNKCGQALPDSMIIAVCATITNAFGWATVSPDDTTVVFSLISNSVFDTVNPESQIIAVPINGGQAYWIAVGGKPAFGRGPFTVVPAISTTSSPSVMCPKSLVSRLKIGHEQKCCASTFGQTINTVFRASAK